MTVGFVSSFLALMSTENHLRTGGLEQRVPLGSQEWASIASGLFSVFVTTVVLTV